MEETIINALAKTASQKGISLEIPENEEHGDYSTNIAMQMFAGVKEQKNKRIKEKPDYFLRSASCKNPHELAEEIVGKLKTDKQLKKIVDRIEVAGPGFINFWLSKDALIDNLMQIDNEKEKYGQNNFFKGKKIMVEFGQPNTHKMPHIGHLFSYIYGESLARIIEKAGARVFRANYQGDVGLHVAKCLWALKKENPQIPENLEDKVALLQKMYVKGNFAYDQEEKANQEIVNLNLQIYHRDKKILPLWQKTRKWSVDYYEEFESRLGIKYDKSYFESEVFEKGIEIVKQNIGRIFKKSQEAVIFEGSNYNLHDRVFMTKLGTPTYEAKDMALETLKYSDWPFDLLIITTANEQNAYFQVIFKALELIDPKFAGKLKHIGFGMVNLKGGKLSSREGKIISAIELVDKTVHSIETIISKGRGLTDVEKETIAEIAGMAAVKYSFLKNNPLQNISFDLKESISQEGNSGPYLQYTYARTQSVLQKAKGLNLKTKNFRPSAFSFQLNNEELAILRALTQFSGVITDAAKNYSPNLLCNYLYDLASKFNNFYNCHKIIGGKNAEFRLQLTSATGQVLKNGLELLGIKTPERM